MKRINLVCIYAAILLFCFLLLPISAGAIPCLGVGPGAPGSGGTYFGPEPGDDSYQKVFADNFVGGTDGFALPASGGELTVWYGGSGFNPDTDVYLLTTVPSAGSFSFGGTDFDPKMPSLLTDTVAAYKNARYFGVNLGSVGPEDKLNAGWSSLEAGEFAGKGYYHYTAEIIYTGDFKIGDWMFAIADAGNNKKVKITGGEFSPKTTSSSTAPIPSAMLLLGTGLVGLAGLRRKFKK